MDTVMLDVLKVWVVVSFPYHFQFWWLLVVVCHGDCKMRRVADGVNLLLWAFWIHHLLLLLWFGWNVHISWLIGCPKYSNNLIFASLRTFRILRIPDLNIFKLWISGFASLRFELRISWISRIYSENCS